MEIKRNEATNNRPDGDRVIDGTYVFIDIHSFLTQLKEEKAWEKNDRNGITVFKSNALTMVLTALRKSAVIKENSVDGFITWQVLDGKVRVTTPDGDIDAEKGQILAFHPNIVHSLEALTDTKILLTTYTQDEEQ